MKEHSENYRFFLNITRETFRVNVKKYEQYLNERKFNDPKPNKKLLSIQKTVMP